MNGQFKIGDVSTTRYFVVVGLILGLVFGLLAPGEDSVSDLILRLLQWQFQVLVPIFLLIFIHLVLHKIPLFDRLNPWLKLCLSGLMGALVFTPMALTLDLYLNNESIAPGEIVLELADELAGVAPPVIVCWVAINGPWLLGLRLTKQQAPVSQKPATSASEAAAVNAPFFDLLPADIGRDIVSLKSELHYLRVDTLQGHCLILYNLKDAINGLPDGKGIQCHRSYWVALKHIKDFENRGRQGQIVTSTGTLIPVSRNKKQAVLKQLNTNT